VVADMTGASSLPRRDELLRELMAIPAVERDSWVDSLLGLPEAPPDESGLPAGAVPYLPCGVDEILTVIRDAPVTTRDEFVDLGSGLGRVLMLAHLITGARCHGIELQQTLVRIARERCAALGLDAVTFAHGSAADLELEGSVFFLYAPFNGELQRRVVARLEAVAQRHRIVVCTVDLELRVPWLQARRGSSLAVTIYDPVAH
jgi:hypothetical protein